MREGFVNYENWERGLPQTITDDPLWHVQSYRLALFVADICWRDVTKLSQDYRTRSLSDQLYRAIGSIGANIAEGYSRKSNLDQARFYEYALGSAREARDWYFKARHILGENVVEHRLDLLTQVIRLLLKTVPQKRTQMLKENSPDYETTNAFSKTDQIPF